MAKSISDKIARIANKPAVPDYDIEDGERAVFEHREHGSDDESQSDSDDEKLANAHYVEVGKSQLRDQGIALRDEKYQGAKGSRKNVYSEDDSEAEDIDGSDGESDAGSDAASDSGSNDGNNSESGSSDGENHSDSAASLRTDSEDEALPEDEDTELKRQRLAAMVQRDARAAVSKLSETTHRDALKGYAVAQQHRTFDQILDTRIKVQKAVNAANKLPLTKESWRLFAQKSSQNEARVSGAIQLLEKVLGQLLDFRQELQVSDKIGGAASMADAAAGRKRSFAQLCEQSRELDEPLREYRRAVLHKWSHKISSASGQSALSAAKFKAINQPADVQVENQLADMPRLLKRTVLNRRNVEPLGFEKDLKEGRLAELSADTDENAQTMDVDADADVPANYDPRRKDNRSVDSNVNPYVFDDEDFYRVLLNDLVDKKVANAQSDGGNVTIAVTSRSNNKLKKNVDTKASKGRKLNFSIQEPLANYEAPANGGLRWSDEQIDEFCAGLLGQRVSFDEEVTAEAAEEAADDENLVQNDGIQLFG